MKRRHVRSCDYGTGWRFLLLLLYTTFDFEFDGDGDDVEVELRLLYVLVGCLDFPLSSRHSLVSSVTRDLRFTEMGGARERIKGTRGLR